MVRLVPDPPGVALEFVAGTRIRIPGRAL